LGGISLANLTTKELAALQDQIDLEQTLVKKYQAMANMCNDTQIQKGLSDYAQRHQRHCDTLMTFLQ
jgi:ferritin